VRASSLGAPPLTRGSQPPPQIEQCVQAQQVALGAQQEARSAQQEARYAQQEERCAQQEERCAQQEALGAQQEATRRAPGLLLAHVSASSSVSLFKVSRMELPCLP